MGKKKKTTIVEEIAPGELGEGALPEGELLDEQLPESVSAVMDELGDDVVRVVLFRTRTGGRQVYVGTIDADEFSLDAIARQYGGGRYLARLRGETGFLPNRSRTFYIDEGLKPEPERVGGHDGGRDTLTEKLIDRLAGGGGKDPMEIAAALGQVAATQSQTMMTAMLSMLAPLLAKLTETKQTPASDVLAAVEVGMQLGGRDEGYLPVIREFGPPIVNALHALSQKQGKAGSLMPGAKQVGAPVAVPPTTTATPEQPSALPEWAQMIAPHIGKVVEFAQRGATPGVVASAMDLQYPRVARWLEQAVLDPAFAPQLFQYFPALTPIKPWVEEFLAEFLPDEPPEGVTHDDE